VEPLDAVETRVLGCLLEKQQTTPDAYPLTLNSLRLACNQATNRDPVVEYDEATVRDAAQRVGRRGLARLASYHGSRAAKYRHTVDEALGVSPDERALLCVLMLRGPQTPGELKQRSERLHRFEDTRSVEEALEQLSERGLGRWLERRPGQKEARYAHLLQEESGERAEPAGQRDAEPIAADGGAGEGGADVAAEVRQLREELDALRAEVAGLRERLDAG
jgi:uncharacterized protein